VVSGAELHFGRVGARTHLDRLVATSPRAALPRLPSTPRGSQLSDVAVGTGRWWTRRRRERHMQSVCAYIAGYLGPAKSKGRLAPTRTAPPGIPAQRALHFFFATRASPGVGCHWLCQCSPSDTLAHYKPIDFASLQRSLTSRVKHIADSRTSDTHARIHPNQTPLHPFRQIGNYWPKSRGWNCGQLITLIHLNPNQFSAI
jgi:hypothetical protein